MFICINDFTCLHSIASRREAGHGQYVPPVVTVRRQGSQQIWQNSVNPGLINRFKGGINGRIICNVPLMGFNGNHHFNII